MYGMPVVPTAGADGGDLQFDRHFEGPYWSWRGQPRTLGPFVSLNLSGDKPRVLRETFRVLNPGGRFAVSDVGVQGELPAALRKSMNLWAGCIAGALEETTYRQLLSDAGFLNVGVEVTRVYDAHDLAASECCDDSLATQSASRS